jgi:Domain of unknown function (DUF6894)
MRRYFFEIVETARRHSDLNGQLLPNDEAAKACARRIMRELAEGYEHKADGWVMEVVENRRVIARMRFDGQPPH